MAETKKIEELKRAYADIILNMAQESSARILVSERKAIEFQRELAAAKEEAVAMLLRLKGIMHSQERRIKELEFHLSESFDTICHLRTELTKPKSELEKKMNGVVQPNKDSNGLSNLFEERQLESLCNCGSNKGDILSFQKITKSSSHEINCHCNLELMPMMLRSKEPDIGFTERMHAKETNLLTEKPIPSRTDRLFSNLEGEFLLESDRDKPERPQDPNSPGTSMFENNVSGKPRIKETGHKTICPSRTAFKFFKQRSRRKCCSKGKNVSSSLSNISLLQQTVSNSPEQEIFADSCEAQFKNVGMLENVLETHCKSRNCTTVKMIPASGEDADTKAISDINKKVGCKYDSIISLSEGSTLLSQPDKPCLEENCISLTKKLEKNDTLTMKHEVRCDEARDSRSSTAMGCDGFLKYTFKRKRKREASTQKKENEIPEKRTFRSSSTGRDKEDTFQQSQMSMQSTRDSRRLAQVARQLISLSEKKWW